MSLRLADLLNIVLISNNFLNQHFALFDVAVVNAELLHVGEDFSLIDQLLLEDRVEEDGDDAGHSLLVDLAGVGEGRALVHDVLEEEAREVLGHVHSPLQLIEHFKEVCRQFHRGKHIIIASYFRRVVHADEQLQGNIRVVDQEVGQLRGRHVDVEH